MVGLRCCRDTRKILYFPKSAQARPLPKRKTKRRADHRMAPRLRNRNGTRSIFMWKNARRLARAKMAPIACHLGREG
jgi:hypothetical protein